MIDLNDLEAIDGLDSENVLEAVEAFADQCRGGWEIGMATGDLPDATSADSVVVLGMGGSGVSGDVVQSVIEPRLPIPFRTIKSYGPLPEWIGRNTLVFAVSYSGNTEETLAALEIAHSRGCRIITVASGGEVKAAAERYGLAHVAIPTGLQPRASLGYLAMPILAVLVKIGLVPDLQSDVDEALSVLSDLGERCHRKRSNEENPAKDLAMRLHGRIPVVYGSHGLPAVAAYRFKCDLNEYGKTPAYWHELPELDHNEIVGWKNLDDLTRRNIAVVLIRDSDEHERIKIRFEITKRLIEGNLAETVEIHSEGVSALARILSLILVTQLAAIYVGFSYDVDPGPVDVITQLKTELAQR